MGIEGLRLTASRVGGGTIHLSLSFVCRASGHFHPDCYSHPQLDQQPMKSLDLRTLGNLPATAAPRSEQPPPNRTEQTFWILI